MMTTLNGTVAVVGASARAAACSLIRQGMDVVAADCFADADLRQLCPTQRIASYPEGFLHWLKETQCDCWIYTGGLENHAELIDTMARIRPLWGNDGNTLRRVRDPLRLQAALTNAGFLFPETVALSTGLPDTGRWLSKTGQGSGGAGVATASLARYYQRDISGTPLAAVYRDDHLLGITRQFVGEAWTGAGEFQYCGSLGPWPLAATMQHHLEQLGRFLNQELRLRGWYGVDLMHAEDELWVIEVNPRYTASIEIVEHMNTNTTTIVGKAILFAKEPVQVDADLSQSLLQEASPGSPPQWADIPQPATTIQTGHPILTLFAQDATQEAVLDQLQMRVTQLRSRLHAPHSSGGVSCELES